MKKIIAILSVVSLLFCVASCGKNKDDKYNTQNKKSSVVADGEEYTQEPLELQFRVDETTTAPETTTEETTEKTTEETTEKETKKTTKKVETTRKPLSGKSTLSEVCSAYISAAKNTSKNIVVKRSKELVEFDGGDGGSGNTVETMSNIESSFEKALSRNSGAVSGVRGYPSLITKNDFSSASVSTVGNYTTIYLKIKDYTANASGKYNEGTVGRTIGVMNTLNDALKSLPDFNLKSTSHIKLNYTNAAIKARIDNTKNVIVSATWEYDLEITADNTVAEAYGNTITLNNAKVKIAYKASF